MGHLSTAAEIEVLRGIDLVVGEHEAIALIGAAGGRALLRCIDLLEEIDDGDILLDGEPITVPGLDPVLRAARRLGLVFQAYNLFPHLRVIDNVILGARSVRRGWHATRRRRPGCNVARALRSRWTGATDDPDRLSGASSVWPSPGPCSPTRAPSCFRRGHRQRPGSGAVGEVLEVIGELKADGATMVIATHEMGFARDIADQVCFWRAGHLERGTPSDLHRARARGDAEVPGLRLLAGNRVSWTRAVVCGR